MDLLGNQTLSASMDSCTPMLVGATLLVQYKGWNFLCCDRQSDPSGLSGLQLKAEQEHSQGRDWMFTSNGCQNSCARGSPAARSEC